MSILNLTRSFQFNIDYSDEYKHGFLSLFFQFGGVGGISSLLMCDEVVRERIQLSMLKLTSMCKSYIMDAR